MPNYTKTHIKAAARTELHDLLALTGAEISINHIPAGGQVPFVHAHKNNEEIYAILEGRGAAVIDGEKVELHAGDWLKLAPQAKRQFLASPDEPINFICIQVKANSLGAFTANDAIVC
ncbi:MAG: cupin domain-containing protein [Kiritimatiellia bacterium]